VAINFLGDATDALKTALSLRESLLNEDPNVEPRLQVSMGINLGPVRLVRDVNGQPCIVGDGINVAQRVMGFADVSQILVSRSYYDAVLRVAPQYASLFHYQGSRTDKHVREHEVFAIGYPEDKAPRPVAAQMREKRAAARQSGLFGAANRAWHAAAMRLEVLVASQLRRLRDAKPRQRAIYAGTIAVPLLLLLVLVMRLVGFGETSGAPAKAGEPHVEAASAVPSSLGLRFSARLDNLPADSSGVPATNEVIAQPQSSRAPQYEQLQESPPAPNVEKPANKESGRQKAAEGQGGGGIRNMNIDEVVQYLSKRFAASPAPTTRGGDATVVVDCTDGATVFVDGRKKGVISSGSLTFTLSPGKHQIGINDMTRGSIYSEEVVVQPGKTMTIKPNFCL
jgi:hypothetical protein